MEKDWKFEAKFQELCGDFNFELVEKVMYDLNWAWSGDGQPPTIYDMKETIRRLFKEVYYGKIPYTATGGFSVSRRDGDEEGEVIYELRFILESNEILDKKDS